MNNFFNNGYPGVNRFPVASYNQPVMSMYNQQQMQQPLQQQMQQPIPQQVPMNELPIAEIKFLNANQIKGYIANPGTKALLIDKANGLAHLIGADYSGNTDVQIFKFENYVQEEEKPVVTPILDDKLYVKRDELDYLLIELNNKIQKLSSQIKDKNFYKKDKFIQKEQNQMEVNNEQ